MYIIPDTTIRLLKDVPLDNTYDHTVYFANQTAQINWFADFTKYTLTAQSYQRLQKGKMRVERRAENLYDCNYIMYQNSSFGNKWFYAFITGVEYINNETSEITFQIDVMQTWYFDYTVDQCFIEREHSATDVAGDNIVPENLELGEYVTGTEYAPDFIDKTLSIVIATNYWKEDDVYKDTYGELFAGMYSTLKRLTFPLYDSDYNYNENAWREAYDAIDDINGKGKGDSILGVFILPNFLRDTEGYHTTVTRAGKETVYIAKPDFSSYRLDGYLPKNKKLYTYPFNFLYLTNNSGDGKVLEYEYFTGEGNSMEFIVTGDTTLNPTILCIPVDYKGVGEKVDESLSLKGFPQCPHYSDAYKAWLAQNSAALTSQTALGIGAGLLGTAAGIMSSNPVMVAGGLASGIGAVMNTVAQVQDHSAIPKSNRGQSQTAPLLCTGKLHFSFYRKHITAQFARIIDEFFDRFGYKTNRNKVPNHCNTRFTRPKWGYTKTISCSITGSVPVDDMAEICGIYDNGITFWRSNATICDYTQDNRVGARVQSSNVGSAVSG